MTETTSSVLPLSVNAQIAPADFLDAETTLLGLWEREELPVARRLWIGARLLEAWEKDQAFALWQLEQEPLPVSESELRSFQAQFLTVFCAGFSDPALQAPGALAHGPIGEAARLMLPRIVGNREISLALSLTGVFNLAILMYALARQIEGVYPDAAPAAAWADLEGLFLEGRVIAMLAKLAEAGLDWREWLGDPTFGQGLLGYFQAETPAAH